MYQPDLHALGGSLGWTAALSVLPLLTLFVCLGVFRLAAWKASLLSFGVAIVVALGVFSMPAGPVVAVATQGAAFGVFPVLWIVINAIWLYNLTVHSGHFDVLRRSFERISDDRRIQAVLIAFCFGAVLEALAGFGAPVAVTAVMLIALGFRPMKAACAALLANTAPVAFGGLAVPIVTLSSVTGLDADHLSAIVGRQTPILAVFVPVALAFLVDGWRGVRETWLVTVPCGVAFALAQFVTSNYIAASLADVIAALVSAAVVVLILRVWQPHRDKPEATDSRAEVLRAYAPYSIIVVIFVLASVPPVDALLKRTGTEFRWFGLHLRMPDGAESTLPMFDVDWLSSAGTLVLISGVLTALVLGVDARAAVRSYGRTLAQLWSAIITVMCVLGVAYVMNASGQTAALGAALAATGAAFTFLAPIVGWFGVAVTGSDTSSNSLFGALQVTAAQQIGASPYLLAAANSAGGVLGKMISPQTLAIAATAVGMAGDEGRMFRKMIGWSLGMLLIMCVLVYLQSTPILGWMVPTK